MSEASDDEASGVDATKKPSDESKDDAKSISDSKAITKGNDADIDDVHAAVATAVESANTACSGSATRSSLDTQIEEGFDTPAPAVAVATLRDKLLNFLAISNETSPLTEQAETFFVALDEDRFEAFQKFVEDEFQSVLKDIPTYMLTNTEALRRSWLASKGSELMTRFTGETPSSTCLALSLIHI